MKMCQKDETKREELVWFVEALDAFTNEVVQKALDEQTRQANQVTHIPGVKKPVWEVPDYDFIKSLRRSLNLIPLDYPLNFKVHNKSGDIVKKFRLQDSNMRKKSKGRMANIKKTRAKRPFEKRAGP